MNCDIIDIINSYKKRYIFKPSKLWIKHESMLYFVIQYTGCCIKYYISNTKNPEPYKYYRNGNPIVDNFYIELNKGSNRNDINVDF